MHMLVCCPSTACFQPCLRDISSRYAFMSTTTIPLQLLLPCRMLCHETMHGLSAPVVCCLRTCHKAKWLVLAPVLALLC